MIKRGWQRLVVTADTLEPSIDLRNSEVFNRALFSRDDQVFQQLAAGIDAGQHEGGGKSLEIRRFGFNLDHGGGRQRPAIWPEGHLHVPGPGAGRGERPRSGGRLGGGIVNVK